MRIQYVSDIHLDVRSSYRLDKEADILILAGDIGQPGKPNYRAFLESLGEYKHVILVSGNHEYYSSSKRKTDIDLELDRLCQSLPNVHYLHMSALDLGPEFPLILGTTLWTHIENVFSAQAIMSDYERIRVGPPNQRKFKINPNQTNEWHRLELAWLANKLNEAQVQGRQCIVVTHHAPTRASTRAYAVQHPNDPLVGQVDDAFATDLDALIAQYTNIAIWVHGHTHCIVDEVIGTTRVLCAPVGYPNESLAPNGNCFEL
jgi:predicted phosphodiesterase